MRLFHVTGSFRGPDDLPGRVEARMREVAAEDLSPWVKLGDVVIRGRRIVTRGNAVHAEARIYDASVLRALQALAGDGSTWNRADDVAVTYGNRSGRGRIDELAIETTSGAFSDISADITVDWSGRRDVLAGGVQGYSAEELTEASLRIALFGEQMPAGLAGMSFMVPTDDPLTALDSLGAPEGSMQALALLLITEHLVGSGRASSIESFSLGPEVQGTRRLEIAWRDPDRYVNQTPELRSISGARQR